MQHSEYDEKLWEKQYINDLSHITMDLYGCKKGDCPVAEQAYTEILSLPMYADLTNADFSYVVESLQKVVEEAGGGSQGISHNG